MPENKKSLAGTSERNLTPKLYPKPKKLSNSQEAALSVFLILLVSVSCIAYFLFILELIYLNK